MGLIGSARERVLAVLAYHKVGAPTTGAWETWFYTPEALFTAHLDYLRDSGWQVIDLSTLLKGLTQPDAIPDRAVLITFDDAYRSVKEVALPRLRRRGLPAVIFAPTAYVGGSNDFDEGVEPPEAICDWEELRELESAGVSVQSHGVRHVGFSRLDAGVRAAELLESKRALEGALGRPVEAFAFPYGDSGRPTDAVDESLREAGYRAAFLYGGGVSRVPVADRYRIARVAIGADTDLRAELALE